MQKCLHSEKIPFIFQANGTTTRRENRKRTSHRESAIGNKKLSELQSPGNDQGLSHTRFMSHLPSVNPLGHVSSSDFVGNLNECRVASRRNDSLNRCMWIAFSRRCSEKLGKARKILQREVPMVMSLSRKECEYKFKDLFWNFLRNSQNFRNLNRYYGSLFKFL